MYSVVVFFAYFVRYDPRSILGVLCLVMAAGTAAFIALIIWLKAHNRSFGDVLVRQCVFGVLWTLLMSLQFGMYQYLWTPSRILSVLTIVIALVFLLKQIRLVRT